MELFTFSAYQKPRKKNKINDCSMKELFTRITPKIQIIIEKFKDIYFKKDELEYRDNSILIAALPVFVSQDSKSGVENKVHDIYRQIVWLKYEGID